MEDKALDDFFAKKDKKKKSKSKSKFTTTDEIAKKLQDGGGGGGQQPKKKKEKEKSTSTAASFQPAASTEADQTQEERERPIPAERKKDEEEWKEFDEPEQKDYSGLRIHALQISAGGEQDEEAAEAEPEYDEEGELIVKPKDATGPWRMVETTSGQAATAPTEPAAAAAAAEPAPKSTGVYRPPGARLAAATQSQPRRGGKYKAPDVHSEHQFPSLQASLEKQPTDSSDRYFERVTRGSRATDNIPGSHGPKLDLENKYAALSKH